MTPVVLDASAMLAMLRGEPGGDVVARALDNSAMATVNLAEVVGFYARRGSGETEINELLGSLPTQLHALDERHAVAVGLLTPITMRAGLSFGDRACLALARQLGARAITADRAWSRIAPDAGVEIELIR
jgi:PIN domain nuclease of toxin-antitoxin system